MGVAALVLGIIGLIISFIPFCGVIAFLPCVVGLALGITDIAVKSYRGQPKAMGIAGTVLNGLALVFIIVWSLFFAAGIVSLQETREKAQKKAQENRNNVVIETKTVQVKAGSTLQK